MEFHLVRWETLTVAVMEKDASVKSWGFITEQTFNPVLLAINIKDLKPLKTQYFTFFIMWSQQPEANRTELWVLRQCNRQKNSVCRTALKALAPVCQLSHSVWLAAPACQAKIHCQAEICWWQQVAAPPPPPSPFCPNVWQRCLVWGRVILKTFKLQGQLKHQSDQRRCWRRNAVKIIQ